MRRAFRATSRANMLRTWRDMYLDGHIPFAELLPFLRAQESQLADKARATRTVYDSLDALSTFAAEQPYATSRTMGK